MFFRRVAASSNNALELKKKVAGIPSISSRSKLAGSAIALGTHFFSAHYVASQDMLRVLSHSFFHMLIKK